ncbi:solute carrier family 34 (sodium-dependent phosphate cotransporter) [Alteromonadaceae bacterium Bs31]|nr:solute carrier family 34 (sodium-dependent phosphate cotransporter) [Alteromonadaceae bacterium Bs31]
MSLAAASTTSNNYQLRIWLTWLGVIALVFLLLVGVGVIGNGFKWLSGGTSGAEKIFSFASNPIVGVILGTLATALVQSSSTVTSVIVGLVAGGVPVSIAVPMIMGANMGTTITNTIVSLGNIRNGKTFNKSFQAATVHDFFNLYGVLIFLPIEIMFHPLEKLAGVMSAWFAGGADASIKGANIIGAITKPAAKSIMGIFDSLPATLGAILTIATGIVLIIVSVIYLGQLLRSAMTGRAKALVDKSIGRGPVAGIASGTIITVLVQSSSTTTSLVVPLAGSGALTTKQVYPFTMGANIGTCITALLAATAITGQFEQVALQIALVHLLYNIFGVLVFTTVPWLKNLPLRSAEWLGNRAEESRLWAFGYIAGLFFVLPGMVIGGQAAWGMLGEDALVAGEEVISLVDTELTDGPMASEHSLAKTARVLP